MELQKYIPNITAEQEQKLTTYYQMLIDYNQKVNLTAITDEEGVAIKHFGDSLSGLKFISKDSKVLDIGCGAGFPSLVLKIFEPSIDLTLVDSVNKKLIFVQSVIDKLKLDKCKVLHSRAEDLVQRDYDYVVARALSRLNTLVEYSLPMLKKGGSLIAYKSNDIDQEINEADKAISLMGGQITSINQVTIPCSDLERKILVITKVKNSPQGYPRPKNLPRTKPII